MKIEPTKISGAYIITREPFVDERGEFIRVFCRRELEAAGLCADIAQVNISTTKKRGTLRGLHSQKAEFAEDKLVTCLRGTIFDVCVDVRPDSPTYCEWVGAELSDSNNLALYIPKGCAHGYLSLADDSNTLYFVSAFYTPGAEVGYRWDDPAFGIKWPVSVDVVSGKDRGWSYIESAATTYDTLAFNRERDLNLRRMCEDSDVVATASKLANITFRDYKWQYMQTWFGRPIIQYATDIAALQEAIWAVKPDLIIESGIARGGHSLYLASLLHLLELDIPDCVKREVVAIDIDFRKHNREALLSHRLSDKITILDGSSIDPEIVNQVRETARKHRVIMIILDSMHTHEHVYKELEAYAGLVSVGSYIIVQDTCIEFNEQSPGEQRWGVGNNPYTALKLWLQSHSEFEIDDYYEKKALITATPSGWLKRIR